MREREKYLSNTQQSRYFLPWRTSLCRRSSYHMRRTNRFRVRALRDVEKKKFRARFANLTTVSRPRKGARLG